jgi:hypothetical protein
MVRQFEVLFPLANDAADEAFVFLVQPFFDDGLRSGLYNAFSVESLVA